MKLILKMVNKSIRIELNLIKFILYRLMVLGMKEAQ